MAITQVITALPAGPNPASDAPDVFSTKAAARVLAEETTVTEINAFSTQANALQVDVNAKQVTASAAAVAAAASAITAAINAPVWGAATSYALGSVVYSPIDFYTYRNKVAGVHATDPSSDSTNWALVASAPTGSSTQAFLTAALTTAGLVDLSGAAAGQIKFPATQNASTDANTLDDYEEGTCSLVIDSTGGASSGQSYSGSASLYTKIGNLITITSDIYMLTKGTIPTGSLRITGLPFPIKTVSYSATSLMFNGLNSNWVSVYGYGAFGTSYASILGVSAAASGRTALVDTDVKNTSELIFQFSYFTG